MFLAGPAAAGGCYGGDDGEHRARWRLASTDAAAWSACARRAAAADAVLTAASEQRHDTQIHVIA